jgi:hypothetical protein
MANPSRITQAPTAPSPTRYHVLPEQPPERIMPTPKSAPPTRLDSQWSWRTGISASSKLRMTWTPAMATRRASTYARKIAVSPARAAFEIARVRQKPPRCRTKPKTMPVASADTMRGQSISSMRAC